jgi:hypothetical protein
VPEVEHAMREQHLDARRDAERAERIRASTLTNPMLTVPGDGAGEAR